MHNYKDIIDLSNIYSGALIRKPNSTEIDILNSIAFSSLQHVFKINTLDQALQYHNSKEYNPVTFFARLSSARTLFRASIKTELLENILLSLGINTSYFVIDKPTLRFVIPQKEISKESKPAYSAHRDTWYNLPQSLINIWTPIHTVTPSTAFSFLPHYFDKPISNSSGKFPTDPFPTITAENYNNVRTSFSLKNQTLIFSGHHLHQTNFYPNLNTCRISYDWRIWLKKELPTVILPPNVDNSSVKH